MSYKLRLPARPLSREAYERELVRIIEEFQTRAAWSEVCGKLPRLSTRSRYPTLTRRAATTSGIGTASRSRARSATSRAASASS